MHLTCDPLILLTALAFLVPWTSVGTFVRRKFFAARVALLCWRLRRRYALDNLVVAVGGINRTNNFGLLRRIRAAEPGTKLVFVIDTLGGDTADGLQLMRALAEHPGPVHVRVPDECWSSGAYAACAADMVIMSSTANLGPADSIGHHDSSDLRYAAIVTAADRGEPVELVRAKHGLRDIVAEIAKVKVAMGWSEPDAWAFAERLVTADVEHARPYFPDEALAMGFPVIIDDDPEPWLELIRLAAWAR